MNAADVTRGTLRPLKVWIGILHAMPGDEARHRDGRPAAQVRAAVCTHPAHAAATRLRMTS